MLPLTLTTESLISILVAYNKHIKMALLNSFLTPSIEDVALIGLPPNGLIK